MNPVPRETNFFVDQPITCARYFWMILRDARFAQTDLDNRGVPNGRHAWLDPQRILLKMHELKEFVVSPHHLMMIIPVAEGLEGDQRIEDPGKDGGQAVASFEAFQHPLFGFGESEFPEGMEAIPCRPFGELVQLVQP